MPDRPDFPTASWSVRGELLHALDAGAPVSLISRRAFGDFDLSFKWRIPVGGNSGVLYRVSERGEAPWETGLEMQLLDNAGHPEGRLAQTSCGALYGLYAPQDVPSCPPGLFNIGRISVRGMRVEHWLNGVRVLACDLGSADFRARVARSRFRGLPRFGCERAGHIVLQHHGSDAWFYNLRIESPAQIGTPLAAFRGA